MYLQYITPTYGNIQALAFKSFPVSTEPFIEAAPQQNLVVTDTPIGKLGVLICADSWYPQYYKIMQEKGAEVVVVPTYITGNGKMAIAGMVTAVMPTLMM